MRHGAGHIWRKSRQGIRVSSVAVAWVGLTVGSHNVNGNSETASTSPGPKEGGQWTLLSNHGLVLLEVTRNPRARIRDIAAAVGLTDRACQRILRDLSAAGYLSAERARRRNVYTLHTDRNLPHPLTRMHTVRDLLAPLCREHEQSRTAISRLGNRRDVTSWSGWPAG